MRVLVCGGRDYTDHNTLFNELDMVDMDSRIEELIHGGARGADALAGEWVRARGRIEIRVDAQWDKYGPKIAGPIRNSEMLLLKPDLVVAFPGGSGTADMVRKAKNAGVKVLHR